MLAGDGQRPDSRSPSGTRWRLPLLTKRTPGVAGVVGSGARQQPRPNVSGQDPAALLIIIVAYVEDRIISEQQRSEAVCSLTSRAAEEPRTGPGGGAWSDDGEAQGGRAPMRSAAFSRL